MNLLVKLIPSYYLEKKITEKIKTISVPKHFFDKLTVVKLYGHAFPAPGNYESYLAHRYGSDWRVPAPQYNYFTDDKALIS